MLTQNTSFGSIMSDLIPLYLFIHNIIPIQYSPFSHRIPVLVVSAEESKISSVVTFSDVANRNRVSQSVCTGLSRNERK